jgi:hypothetical protein
LSEEILKDAVKAAIEDSGPKVTRIVGPGAAVRKDGGGAVTGAEKQGDGLAYDGVVITPKDI